MTFNPSVVPALQESMQLMCSVVTTEVNEAVLSWTRMKGQLFTRRVTLFSVLLCLTLVLVPIYLGSFCVERVVLQALSPDEFTVALP